MARLAGPWQTRVSFAPGGGFAYRPGEVVVRDPDRRAQGILVELSKQAGVIRDEYEEIPADDIVGSFVRYNGVPDALDAVVKLNEAGIYAQVNHVLFAHNAPDAAGFQANPFYANPFYANPFYANPFYANPFYANPFYANPFYANPFYANPFYANPNPAADPGLQQTGRRPSSARPTKNPAEKKPDDSEEKTEEPAAEVREVREQPRILILDTGYAKAEFRPPDGPQQVSGDRDDAPDSPKKGYLDPVAGHGTFIAGIIEQVAPGCALTVGTVINPFGDGDEVVVGKRLNDLTEPGEVPPHLVNLSFGGYSSSGMGVLAEAISKLHYAGSVVVASAGNDGTSVPMYPAAIPHVLAVGALDHEGAPAPFTNYGPWVRACTLGVEVVSTFFNGFTGAHPVQAGDDIDDFTGWAVWSGTSFAAPRVVAKLAKKMQDEGSMPHEAVHALIDAPKKERLPLLGTVIR